ncbi:MAG TPA: hypothetical protein VD994_08845 [Prosthecobacter sp.]|nr:hypothetical protein [Prosthecobacter sp.]
MILRFHYRSKRRRGAALLAVLWVVALLIGLVAGASLMIMQDLDMSGVKRQVFRARMLGEAALAIAMNPDVKPDDPLLRQQVGPDERFEVELTGEDGLLNPNVLLVREDRATLRRVFLYWGLTPQQSDLLIDSLLDWVDGDDFVRVRGAESKAYGRNGMPFNRPFRSIEEMAMVRGMQDLEQIYPSWRTWFSVYASGVLDLNSAQPEMIAAVTGADIRRAQQVRSMRLGRDGRLNTQDDYEFKTLDEPIATLGVANADPAALVAVLSVQSLTRRILVKVQVGDFQREVAVVARGTQGQATNSILWMGER